MAEEKYFGDPQEPHHCWQQRCHCGYTNVGCVRFERKCNNCGVPLVFDYIPTAINEPIKACCLPSAAPNSFIDHRFSRGFTGEEIAVSGTYDYTLSPIVIKVPSYRKVEVDYSSVPITIVIK